MQLNINADAAVKFTNKLEKLHRSALPNAVRSTLNSAAFDVKQKTMPETSKKAFVNRQPNFFKANSRVDMAKGWDLKTMKATVGFTEQGLKGGNNFAVKDLEQQEYGGAIKKKSFIPLDPARGGNKAKPVRPMNRLSQITRIANSNKGMVRGKNKAERFVKSAIHAGAGGYVIGNFDKKTLFRIDSLRRVKGNTVIKKKAIYSFEENRSVRVGATGFMKKASLMSAKKMNDLYIKEAEKQVKRLTK
jgi:hypothetical protein